MPQCLCSQALSTIGHTKEKVDSTVILSRTDSMSQQKLDQWQDGCTLGSPNTRPLLYREQCDRVEARGYHKENNHVDGNADAK